jgi:hypothetical protein
VVLTIISRLSGRVIHRNHNTIHNLTDGGLACA